MRDPLNRFTWWTGIDSFVETEMEWTKMFNPSTRLNAQTKNKKTETETKQNVYKSRTEEWNNNWKYKQKLRSIESLKRLYCGRIKPTTTTKNVCPANIKKMKMWSIYNCTIHTGYRLQLLPSSFILNLYPLPAILDGNEAILLRQRKKIIIFLFVRKKKKGYKTKNIDFITTHKKNYTPYSCRNDFVSTHHW